MTDYKTATGVPLPRSLATRSAIRRELISLYRQSKSGQLPPEMSGRLIHLLSVLASMTTQERPQTRAEREAERRNQEVANALSEQNDALFAKVAGVRSVQVRR